VGFELTTLVVTSTDYIGSSKSSYHTITTALLLQLINYLTCSTMFLVTNIDQMYKEMKKIVEVGNKNGNEFPDFLSIYFFFGIENVRVVK
jgi:hypothetical protein